MKLVEIKVNKTPSSELLALQKKSGLKASEISRKLSESLGNNQRSWATLYSSYVNGKKGLSPRAIPVLAKILKTTPEELKRIDSMRKAECLSFSLPVDMLILPLFQKGVDKNLTVGELLFKLHQLHTQNESDRIKKYPRCLNSKSRPSDYSDGLFI